MFQRALIVLALLLGPTGCDDEQLRRLPQLAELVFGKDREALPTLPSQLVTDPDIPHISLAQGGAREILYKKYRGLSEPRFHDDNDGDPFEYDEVNWDHQGARRRYTRDDPNYEAGMPDFVKVEDDRLYVVSLARGLSVFDLDESGEMTPVGEFDLRWPGDGKIVVKDKMVMLVEPRSVYHPENEDPETKQQDWVPYGRVTFLDTTRANAASGFDAHAHVEVFGHIIRARVVGERLYVVAHDNRRCKKCKRNPHRTQISVFDVSSFRDVKKIETIDFNPNDDRNSFAGWAKITSQGIYIPRYRIKRNGGMTKRDRFEIWSYKISKSGELGKVVGPMVTKRGFNRPSMLDDQGDDLRVAIPAAGGQRGIEIEVFSLKDEDAPRSLGKTQLDLWLDGWVSGVVFDTNRVYISTKEGNNREIQVVELAPSSAPRWVSKISLPPKSGAMVAPDGERLILLQNPGWDVPGPTEVTLWDLQDPEAPSVLSELELPNQYFASYYQDGMTEDKLWRYVPGQSSLWLPVLRKNEAPAEGSNAQCSESERVLGLKRLDWDNDQLKLRSGVAEFWGDMRFAALRGDSLFSVGLSGVRRFQVQAGGELETHSSSSLYLSPTWYASSPNENRPLFRLGRGHRDSDRKLQVIDRTQPGKLTYIDALDLDLDDQDPRCPKRSLWARLYAYENRAHILSWRDGKGSRGARLTSVEYDERSGLRRLGSQDFDIQGLSAHMSIELDNIDLDQQLAVQKGRYMVTTGKMDQASELLVFDLGSAKPKLLHRFPRPEGPYAGRVFDSSEREVSSWYAQSVDAHPGELKFFWQRVRFEQEGRIHAISTQVPGVPLAQSKDGLTGLVLGFSKEETQEVDIDACFGRSYLFYYDKTAKACHRLLPQLHHVALLGKESMLLSTQSLNMEGFRLARISRGGHRVILTHWPHSRGWTQRVKLGEGEAEGEAEAEPYIASRSQTSSRQHQLFSLHNDFQLVQGDLAPFDDPEDTRLRFEGPDRILRRIGWNEGDLLRISENGEIDVEGRFTQVDDHCYPLSLFGEGRLWCPGYYQGLVSFSLDRID